MRLKISPFAEKDLEESIKFYNNEQEGLGQEFAEEVDNTIERIKENPNQFPKEHKQLRKASTNRFPFNIFYVVKDMVGYVLGVFHTSRNPESIKARYKDSF